MPKESSAPAASDEVCEKCGKPMVRRRSRFGEFLGCSGYPDCDGIKRARRRAINTGVGCPDCKEGEFLERRSRRGKIFYGCGRYPKCKFASWDRVVLQPCPACGSTYLVEKTTKREALDGNVRTRNAAISSRPLRPRPPRSRSSRPPRPSPSWGGIEGQFRSAVGTESLNAFRAFGLRERPTDQGPRASLCVGCLSEHRERQAQWEV